jgi:N4-gp56 family major capsid protein
MGITNFNTNSQRVGIIKGEILAHAVPAEVLGITGAQKRLPKNSGDTVKFRRWLPYGGATTNANTINRWSVTAAAHVVSEGVTPSVDSLTPQDITAVLEQYACLYGFTDKTFDLYEDDMPTEMRKQVGERMGLVREMIRYNTLKAGTNAYFSGGTSRATVDEKISLNILRRVARNILANHGKQITSVLAASPDFNTTPVEAAFLVFCHSDCEADIRDLPGCKLVSEYGQRKVIHEMEVGSVERFRFIISPELSSYADSGAAVGSTGLYSTSASNIDVYPYIVVAEDAWGQVALRGMDSFDTTYIPPGNKDKNDPLGQRGYAGAKFYQTAVILNQGWCAVVEAGVSSLS